MLAPIVDNRLTKYYAPIPDTASGSSKRCISETSSLDYSSYISDTARTTFDSTRFVVAGTYASSGDHNAYITA